VEIRRHTAVLRRDVTLDVGTLRLCIPTEIVKQLDVMPMSTVHVAVQTEIAVVQQVHATETRDATVIVGQQLTVVSSTVAI